MALRDLNQEFWLNQLFPEEAKCIVQPLSSLQNSFPARLPQAPSLQGGLEARPYCLCHSQIRVRVLSVFIHVSMDIFVCLLAASLYPEATARSHLALRCRIWLLGL